MPKKETMDLNFGEAVRSLEFTVFQSVFRESTTMTGRNVYRIVDDALYGWASVDNALTRTVSHNLPGVLDAPGPLTPALYDFLRELGVWSRDV